jgi:adenine-specific DNA-methyltransferase
MIKWLNQHYARGYAENTRETIRDHSVAPLCKHGLVVKNPDDPKRKVNSGRTCYEIEPGTLAAVQYYGGPDWPVALDVWQRGRPTISERFTHEESLRRVPVSTRDGQRFELSEGPHSVLIRDILEVFVDRWARGAQALYIGDTGERFGLCDREGLRQVGIELAEGGKLPDVILWDPTRRWLIIVEAVSEHGPLDEARMADLSAVLAGHHADGVVYVTAFATRSALKQYVPSLAWRTEVWLADEPDHLIHFDGDHYLGPYLPPA